MKAKVRASVRLKVYDVIARAVDEGIDYGTGRALKHTDKPSAGEVGEECRKAVLNALCEVIDFDQEGA